MDLMRRSFGVAAAICSLVVLTGFRRKRKPMKIMAICMVPLMARSGRRLATKLPTNVITSTPMSSGRLFLTSRFLCFLYVHALVALAKTSLARPMPTA